MKQFTKSPDYNWRGKNMTRLEALSDAVFGLSLTFLIIDQERPDSLNDFFIAMRGFLPFFFTFLLLFRIWLTQNKFFRWFALEDNFTKWMNALLLFVVLFYVFPLKYLFSIAIAIFGYKSSLPFVTNGSISIIDFYTLEIIFGIGFTLIFSIFGLMYRHAYRKRGELELSQIEVINTIAEYKTCFGIGILAVISCLIAPIKIINLGFVKIPGILFAGLIYLGIIPVVEIFKYRAKKKIKFIKNPKSPSNN